MPRRLILKALSVFLWNRLFLQKVQSSTHKSLDLVQMHNMSDGNINLQSLLTNSVISPNVEQKNKNEQVESNTSDKAI